MKNLNTVVGIVLVLIVSRLIPHPPNFTALIALSFYIPNLFGFRFILPVMIGLLISDFIIGLHSSMFFTFGSVLVISLISQKIGLNFVTRLSGALVSAVIFFIITNFGVWTTGFYGYSFNDLITCYVLAIPFFYGTILSTFLYGLLIELLMKIKLKEYFTQNTNK